MNSGTHSSHAPLLTVPSSFACGGDINRRAGLCSGPSPAHLFDLQVHAGHFEVLRTKCVLVPPG